MKPSKQTNVTLKISDRLISVTQKIRKEAKKQLPYMKVNK